MLLKLLLFALILVIPATSYSYFDHHKHQRNDLTYREKWGYVKVRENANLFWWLYYTADSDRPLILWLQGGPGASSAGFGNFKEIGPLDTSLNPRNSTWLQKADLLFIDQPVGTGFSYVTNDDAYTTNVDEIADDLLSFAKDWFSRHARYQTRPFYVFCESYGGKMTVAFAKVLYQAVQAGDINVNFKGIALGDSWISPMDYVNSWGPYLYAFSMLGDSGLNKTNVKAEECRAMVEQQKWDQATNCWNEAEVLIEALTDGVSFYNVLEREGLDRRSLRLLTHVERLFEKHVRPFEGDDLNLLMNGAVRKKLKIIPDSVQWTESSQAVFTHQSGDFMKPVIDTVDWLLVNTPLNVSVYNGQLDLICDTIGTELWVSRLRWPDLRKFSARDRLAFHVGNDDSRTAGFYKQYNNFRFFWIMRAGHMVPSDNPAAALKMVDMIISH